MSDNKILKIGITQGDINGIGPEMVIKALADDRMCELFTPVIYGSSKVFAHYKKGIEGSESFIFHIVKSAKEARNRQINLVEKTNGDIKIDTGKATSEGIDAASKAFEDALRDLRNGDIDILVSNHFDKKGDSEAEYDPSFHDKSLQAAFETEPLTVMCSEVMKVGLATANLPVVRVSESISKELISKRLKQLKATLINDFRVVEPKIAVLSLNPNSEGSQLEREEKEVIKPAIEEAYEGGIMAFGPFAADTLFSNGGFKKYDAVLAMHHDQGITPFKSLNPEGVKLTASLPAVVTSPDNSASYDIAGKDMADATSMREAIYLAIDIYRNRVWYKEINKNPLKHYERERGADISVRDLKLPEVADI